MIPTVDNEKKQGGPGFDYEAFVAKHTGAVVLQYESSQVIYAQGDPAGALYYIVHGSVKVTVISERGKEGVVALLRPGDFFGEGCLSYREVQATSVTATSACEAIRLSRAAAVHALQEDTAFSRVFMRFLLDRNEKLKDDLLDQLFHSSEKRLARILLTLAHADKDAESSLISIPITQETLANMVGTTRSRVSQFMTKFRKLGYIDYDGQIRVHNSLVNIILDYQPHDLER